MNKLGFIGFMTLAASTLVVVAACSSTDSDPATAMSSGTQAIAKASCNLQSKCDATEFDLQYGSVDECATISEQQSAPSFKLPGITVTNGQLEACANAVNAAGCDDTSAAATAACNFTGSLPDGTSCLSDIQCSSGYCKGSGESSTTTDNGDAGTTVTTSCGTCAERVDVGGACDGDDENCKTGLACNLQTHLCATPPAKGAACDLTQIRCASGLTCVHAICADPVPAGGACDVSQDECAAGLACENGKCSTESDQFTVATLGQPCGVNIGASTFIVCKQSSCVGAQSSQKCVANATAGQACASEATEEGATLPSCNPGLECIRGTCGTPPVPTCN